MIDEKSISVLHIGRVAVFYKLCAVSLGHWRTSVFPMLSGV